MVPTTEGTLQLMTSALPQDPVEIQVRKCLVGRVVSTPEFGL